MSVANDSAATGILGFLVKLYKPIYDWAMATFATKSEAGLHPVDISTLTPNSTFQEYSVVGINGVLYRATRATSNLPCSMVIENGAFVTHTVNGKIAFVVSNPSPNTDWEVISDASIEYWVESINASTADLSTIRSKANAAVKPTDTVTVNGVDYTVSQLLSEMAKLMNIPILGIIENMSYFECPDCGKRHSIYGESHIEEIAAQYDIPVLAKLPIDPQLAKLCDQGTIELFEGEWLTEAAEKIVSMEK